MQKGPNVIRPPSAGEVRSGGLEWIKGWVGVNKPTPGMDGTGSVPLLSTLLGQQQCVNPCSGFFPRGFWCAAWEQPFVLDTLSRHQPLPRGFSPTAKQACQQCLDGSGRPIVTHT